MTGPTSTPAPSHKRDGVVFTSSDVNAINQFLPDSEEDNGTKDSCTCTPSDLDFSPCASTTCTRRLLIANSSRHDANDVGFIPRDDTLAAEGHGRLHGVPDPRRPSPIRVLRRVWRLCKSFPPPTSSPHVEYPLLGLQSLHTKQYPVHQKLISMVLRIAIQRISRRVRDLRRAIRADRQPADAEQLIELFELH